MNSRILLALIMIAPWFMGSASISEASTIRGTVTDSITSKPLELVNVYLKGTRHGGATNPDGYYVIPDVPEGDYTIVFSILGYTVIERKASVRSDETSVLDAALVPKSVEMAAVTVDSRRIEFEKEVGVSSLRIGAREMEKLPSLLHSDLLRVIQAMPGVVSVGDFSTALYVRGGDCDQNLVRLDGATIFNPFHLGGLFSVFETDAVSKAEFLAGGFPARYGNRLSSVLDVTTRTGDGEGFKGIASIGMLYSKLLVEGPVPRGSFLISGRRTYLDKVLPLFDAEFPYYFYDVQSKVSVGLSENTNAFVSGFGSHDLFDFGGPQSRIYIGWDNKAGSMGLSHIFGERLFLENCVTYSEFKYTVDVASGVLWVRDSLGEWGVNSNLSYDLGDNEFDLGVEARRTDFAYRTSFQEGFQYDVNAIPYEVALYWQAKWKLGDRVIVQHGSRLNRFWAEYKKGVEGGAREYFRPVQRIALKYFLTPDVALKAAFSEHFQFVTALIPENDPAPFIFAWAPVFGEYRPEEARHFIVGIEKLVSETGSVSLEMYHKRFGSLLTFNENSDPADMLTDLFHVGDGESYGADALLKKRAGVVTGWLSYSLSRAKVTFENATYFPNYDRRHTFNAIGEARIFGKYTLSTKFTYGSGTPYTPVLGHYPKYFIDPRTGEVETWWRGITGEKNSSRFPDYHRLDVGIMRGFEWRGLDISVSVSVINLYDRKNVLMYYFDYSKSPPTRDEIHTIPRIPSLEVRVSFP
jgi:hypothetical protein